MPMPNILKLIILSLAMLLSHGGTAYAQRSKARPARKKVVKQEPNPSEILFNDMLPATARLLIIDSIVVDKDDFAGYIPLSSDCGYLYGYDRFFGRARKTGRNSFVYVNGFGDKCFYNDSVDAGQSVLYTQELIGGKWEHKRKLDELASEFEDLDYPFLMQDGVTLYFSAKCKDNNLGGRDIYITRLNPDTRKFYEPENIGLPYNSTANDYCCIIDDLNNLGWLVTDRYQETGKVCIYCFVPAIDRWADSNPDIDNGKLQSLARIGSIKESQYDKKILNDARTRLAKMKTAKAPAGKDDDFAFVINDKTTYHRLSDFKSATSLEMFREYQQLKKTQNERDKELDNLRQQYSSAAGSKRTAMSKQIIKMEQESEKNIQRMKILEKKIRNSENLM